MMACGVAGCTEKHKARGFCRLHYMRWVRTGDPLLVPWSARREDHFWSKVDASGDCWEWTGMRDRDGYGKVSWDARKKLTHRLAYELLVGPVPVGLQLDHLCRNRACVNPDHLQPVTWAENLRRGAPRRRPNCRRGHPLSGDNLYARPGSGGRECRTCRLAYQKRWREARSGVV